MVRTKFRVNRYETQLAGTSTELRGEVRRVIMSVVYDGSEENKKFFKWTPTGDISIGLLNEEAWKQFPLGAEIYVDFTPVVPLDIPLDAARTLEAKALSDLAKQT